MQASYLATHFVKDYISLITCKGGVLWRRKRKKEQGVITENKLITLCFVCPGNVLNSSCALPALLGATFCACNHSLVVRFSSSYCAGQRLKDVVVPLLLCPLTLPSEGTCAPNINHLLIAKAFICCCEYLTGQRIVLRWLLEHFHISCPVLWYLLWVEQMDAMVGLGEWIVFCALSLLNDWRGIMFLNKRTI